MTDKSPKSSTLLSVVIPIRGMVNRLTSLTTTLENLSDLPIQIVLVHDDANDGTHEQLETIMKKLRNENISLQRLEVCSPGLARNLGLEKATSDWVAFWDSDDLPNPGAFLNLIRETKERNALVGIGQIASNAGDGSTVEIHLIKPDSKNFLYQLANMPGFTRMVFNRSVIYQTRFNSLRSGEDQCFLRDLNFLNYPYYVSEEVVYVYFTSRYGQLSQNAIAKRDTVKALEHLSNLYRISTGQMRIFSFAQIVKIFFSVFKNLIKDRDQTFFSYGTLKASKVLSGHPLKALQLALYFWSHRVGLAGRRG